MRGKIGKALDYAVIFIDPENQPPQFSAEEGLKVVQDAKDEYQKSIIVSIPSAMLIVEALAFYANEFGSYYKKGAKQRWADEILEKITQDIERADSKITEAQA